MPTTDTTTTDQRPVVSSPKIEVVLVPEPNDQPQTFEVWLVLHVPGGQPPETYKLYDAADGKRSVMHIQEVFTTIRERHGMHSDFDAEQA